jgi:hypothetical protein
VSPVYIYDRQPSGSQSRSTGQLTTYRLAQRNPYYLDRTISGFLGRRENHSRYGWAHEGLGQLTTDELSKKLQHFSFLPHFVERNGKDVPLTPRAMDPGIYDGPQNYKIAPRLQDCLKTVMAMENGKFRHIKVALVDLTKNVMQPEFAASFDHKEPVFAASVPKIAPMLAAYQLRHDLRVAWKQKAVKTLDDLLVSCAPTGPTLNATPRPSRRPSRVGSRALEVRRAEGSSSSCKDKRLLSTNLRLLD